MPNSYLYTSAQFKSSNQSVGFYGISIYPLGPAKKYLHSLGSILSSPNNILVVNINEKNNLCFSNRDLHTFLYNDKVK
jgi:hypothetical protein